MIRKQHVVCPFCEGHIVPDSHYCIFCGRDLADRTVLRLADTYSDPDETVRLCVACGELLPPYSRYCSACGRDQRIRVLFRGAAGEAR